MSVHHKHFILYGYRIDYDIATDLRQETLDNYDHRNKTEGDAAIITDGRAGEYAFLGIIQYESQDSRDGFPRIPVTTPEQPTTEQSIELGETLSDLKLNTEVSAPRHYIFTHTM